MGDKMIVRKTWRKYGLAMYIKYEYEGWFLFGILPLYIRRRGNG